MTNILFGVFFVISVILFILGSSVNKSNYEYKRLLFMLLISASVTVLLCGFAIRSTNETLAYIFNSVYIACTTWLAISLLMFYVAYSGKLEKFESFRKIIAILTTIDTLILISNIFTHKIFTLHYHEMIFGPGGYVFSKLPLYMIHSIYVYSICLTLFIILFRNLFKTKGIYRVSHILFTVSFLIFLVINVIVRFSNTLFDYSIMCYGLLGIDIYIMVIGYLPATVIKHLNNIIISNMNDSVFALDTNNNIIYMNPSAYKLFDYFNISDYNAAVKEFYSNFDLINKNEDQWDTVRKKGRKSIYFTISYKKIYDKKNNYIGDYVIIHDRTEEVKKEISERKKVYYDQLTGLYNRSIFEVKVSEILENINEEYYMICFDVKNFKLINEFYGDKVGDKLLISIADVMKKEFKNDDSIIYSRLQGDRFAIFMPKVSYDNSDIYNKLNAVNKMVDSLNIYLYMGICSVNSKLSVRELMEHAQLAGSIVKHDINCNINFYDNSIKETIYKENKMISSFDNAKKNKEFVLYIQPQISKDGKILGGEALVRWIRDGEVISPGNFIPLFEKFGLISELDKYVWELACKKLNEWKSKGLNYYISINLSSLDFFGMDIYKVLTGLVKKYDIDPKKLKLEITESVFVTKVDELSSLIKKLKDYGFIIEMDDFGSGYSSLNMLKSIDIDVIKMDMGFLYDEEKSDKSRVILEALIKLSKELELEVVTEGVETVDQVNYLKDVGCDIFQGYYFDKPMDIISFEEKYLEV